MDEHAEAVANARFKMFHSSNPEDLVAAAEEFERLEANAPRKSIMQAAQLRRIMNRRRLKTVRRGLGLS